MNLFELMTHTACDCLVTVTERDFTTCEDVLLTEHISRHVAWRCTVGGGSWLNIHLWKFLGLVIF